MKRLNIGLFVANIENVFSNSICKGAIIAAEEMDVNLIIFPGKYIHTERNPDPGQLYEYQYNTLFSYAKKESIDVLVTCISSIGFTISIEQRKRFMNEFLDIPILSVASKDEGYPYVEYDNRSGLREAIEYLIYEKGLTKIAMLGAQTSNSDASERLETYKETLRANHLEIDNGRIVFGKGARECELSVEDLLDRNPDIEAIVCYNDVMAIGVYNVLKKRNIVIGKDILVVGFDDISAAAKLDPPLATVRADAVTLGYQSILESINLSNGKNVENSIVKTMFVPRESVGFDSQDISSLEKVLYSKELEKNDIQKISNLFVDYIFYDLVFDKRANETKQQLHDLFSLMLKLVIDCNVNKNLMEFIKMKYKNLLKNDLLEYTDASKVINIFGGVMNNLFSKNCDTKYKIMLQQMIADFNKRLVDKLKNKLSENKRDYVELNHITNIVSKNMLMLNNDAEQSYYGLLDTLPKINVHHSFLYLFENPIEHTFNAEWKAPENILLKAYQDGEETISLPRTRQKMNTCNLFSHEYMPSDKRCTWIVHDIYSGELQYGLFICDIKYEYFHLIELLTYQLSAAIQIISLFQAQKIFQFELEERLEQIKKHNIKLDRISKVDELTGILNRRGFYNKAEKMLSGKQLLGKKIIVAYADLDYLKNINDKYGHDEGDYAIKSGAEILSKVFKEFGIIGRLSGDEFAALAIVEEEMIVEKLHERIYQESKYHNSNVEKPYQVHVSVGICEFDYKDTLQLKDMLNQADDLLYDAKKNRKSRTLIEEAEIK
ncbi:MAG TPA: GGDEF domain-containing protein [Lachnospiraceae bacterium]|nr:GGDEF domain-containing protein [Lachnospiraceae bacterium]